MCRDLLEIISEIICRGTTSSLGRARATGGPKGWPGYAVAYPKPTLFYPNDFFKLDLIKFKLQLNNYIGDSRHGNNLKCLTNHGYLSVKLVQTERNKIYDMVYNLLKLVIDFSKN